MKTQVKMKPNKWILSLCWSEAWEENALMWTLSYFLDTSTLHVKSIAINFSKCQTIILTNQILKLKKIIQLMTTDGSKHSILVAFTRSLSDFLLRVNLEFHQWESWLIQRCNCCWREMHGIAYYLYHVSQCLLFDIKVLNMHCCHFMKIRHGVIAVKNS